MQAESQRTVGLDLHPTKFTAALLSGTHPNNAKLLNLWDQVPTARLAAWATQHLRAGDRVVLEACANTFDAADRLGAAVKGVEIHIYESRALAHQSEESYCSNDKTSAVKIARVHLSGTLGQHRVWVPPVMTRQRRSVLARQQQHVTNATRARNQIRALLAEHHLRVPKGVPMTKPAGQRQLLALAAGLGELPVLLLTQLLSQLQQAETHRKELAALMAREVLNDPRGRELLRLFGVRHIIAYAVLAIIGDASRFVTPQKLVGYLGLAPQHVKSGSSVDYTKHKRKGRQDLRRLLIEAAQTLLRCKNSPLHQWGWKVFVRRGNRNLATVAVARKLAVQIWHLLRGHYTTLTEVPERLRTKLGQLATICGLTAKSQPLTKADFVNQQIIYYLKNSPCKNT
jgi:transposase